MRNVARFPLDDGSTVTVALSKELRDLDGYRDVSLMGDRQYDGSTSLNQAMDQIRRVANAVVDPLTHITPRPDDVEVAFGVEMDVEAGAVIAAGGSDGHFQVRLRWKSQDGAEER
ncbi:CU044_2847 family protein [Streptomyces sp. NPDC060275]|uniref:CU044_2847 family protein n=1 Tax=Streptomyces sp. NPDC060275 TaxID=3347090 RepID=UPI003651C9CB